VSEPVRPAPRRTSFGITAAVCVVFVAGMVGASFAAVPLYRIFCQVTGYNGTVRRAETAPSRVLDKTITVRFDANVSGGLGWDFAPDVREVKVKIGEVKTVSFHAENLMQTVNTASAVFNVSPDAAGGYFNKLACFCFTQQTLAPHTPTELPVTFFVDPSVVNDVDMSGVDTITLSYTFYPSATPAQANATKPAATGAGPDQTKPL
jgi:cytochrome c oxidase assembly protein subunit 11